MDIKGIDRGKLIAALYNHSKPLGPFGPVNSLKAPMTAEQGTEYYDRLKKENGDISFDYVAGHPIKVAFIGDSLEREDLFDRDAGAGQCYRAVEAARK